MEDKGYVPFPELSSSSNGMIEINKQTNLKTMRLQKELQQQLSLEGSCERYVRA
jgi:hypothetical protein